MRTNIIRKTCLSDRMYIKCIISQLEVVYGYTATSAQHIAKFAKDLCADRIERYMD